MARFCKRQSGIGHHIARMRIDSAGIIQRFEVEYIAVIRGRRPHGCLHFKDVLARGPRGISPAPRLDVVQRRTYQAAFNSIWVNIPRGGVVDRNPARLHRLRNFALQIDQQEAVFEAGALDLDVVGQGELPLERACRGSRCRKVLSSLSPLRPSSVSTLLDRQRHLVRRKAGERHRNLETVLVEPLDVVGGIALFGGPLDLVENVKKAVEANREPPEGSPIIPHSQILQRASWVRAGTGHLPMPASLRDPKAPRPHLCGDQEIVRPAKKVRGGSKIFGGTWPGGG